MTDPTASDPSVTTASDETETTPPFEDILIPTDGSDVVWERIQSIKPISTLLHGRVHALYVHPEGTLTRDRMRADAETEAEETVAAFERKLTDKGLQTTTAVREGVPSEEIVAYAEEHGIDLIVMVTHSNSPMDILRTSTTEKVLDRSDVTLMAISG